MKRISIISILLFVINQTYSEPHWPEAGANWYYSFIPCTQEYCPNEGLLHEYIYFNAVKDTMIKDTLCVKIDVKYFGENDTAYLGSEYIFSKDEQVYNFHHGNFYLMYDFSWEVGEEVELFLGSGCNLFFKLHQEVDTSLFSVRHKIIEKDSVEIDGMNHLYLKAEHVERDGDYLHWANYLGPEMIIKGIGNMSFLIGNKLMPFESNNYGPIRCYNDTENSHKFSDYACDEIVTSITSPEEDVFDVLYPNPGNGIFHVNSGGSENISGIRIYNLFGRLILDQETISIVDISSHPRGLYIYEIEFLDGKVRRGRVLSY